MIHMRLRCTIHNVLFDVEAPEDASPEVKDMCAAIECPVCARSERKKLHEELSRTRRDLDCILRAIVIHRDRLIEQSPDQAPKT